MSFFTHKVEIGNALVVRFSKAQLYFGRNRESGFSGNGFLFRKIKGTKNLLYAFSKA